MHVHSAEQARRVAAAESLWLTLYDLFVVQRGIECAAFPHLYPTTAFTDTDLLEHYQDTTDGLTNRVCSIVQSWTRKVFSSVRAYGEPRDSASFLYERHLAHKFHHAHVRGQRYGVTADVMCRDLQFAAGYWEVVQDSLADLVRVMRDRCFDTGYDKGMLYEHVRGLRGQVSCSSGYLGQRQPLSVHGGRSRGVATARLLPWSFERYVFFDSGRSGVAMAY